MEEEIKKTKLEASIDRIEKIFKKIKTFSPDIVISFCSPEAARISFGLGIKHIAFCDSPHADAVMRLTLPLIQKLLILTLFQKMNFLDMGLIKKILFNTKQSMLLLPYKEKLIKNQHCHLKKIIERIF